MNFYILAGGRSRRMGRNKALIRYRGKTIIEYVMAAIPAPVERIKIITNEKEAFAFLPVVVIADVYPHLGPISGIHAGLEDSPFQFNFFIACDMPLISSEIINFILNRHHDEDIFGLQSRRGPEPLCTIYSKNCVQVVEHQIASGNYSLYDLFKQMPSVFVEPPDSARLFNMNTPHDFKKFKSNSI